MYVTGPNSRIYFNRASNLIAPYSQYANEVIGGHDWSRRIPAKDMASFVPIVSGWIDLHMFLPRSCGRILTESLASFRDIIGVMPDRPVPRIGILTQPHLESMTPLEVTYAVVAQLCYQDRQP